MIAARRDAPRGALVANEDWCVSLFDAVVGVEDRRMNDRSEPLAGRVRRIRRNERVDEDLIPLEHLVDGGGLLRRVLPALGVRRSDSEDEPSHRYDDKSSSKLTLGITA